MKRVKKSLVISIVAFFILFTENESVFAYDCDKIKVPTDYSTMSDNYQKGKRRCDSRGAKYSLEECKVCCERMYYDRKQDRPDFCDILKNPPKEIPQKLPSKTVSTPPSTSTATSTATNNETARELEARKKLQEEEARTQQLTLVKKEKIKNEITERKKEREVLLKDQEIFITNAKERNTAVTFFVGPDYENIGQLRSEIVKNDALIKKIQNQLTDDIDEEDKAVLQGELRELLNQQGALQAILASSEDSFSLFGWVFKFINGV